MCCWSRTSNPTMEPELVRSEISCGNVELVKKNFEQDKRFNMTTCPSKVLHQGKPFMLTLCAKYLSNKDFQEGEAQNLPFRNKEMESEYQQLSEKGLVGRRLVLRKRFPLKTLIPENVLYSTSPNAVIKSYGKVQFISQQKLNFDEIYVKKKVQRRQADARVESESLDESTMMVEVAGPSRALTEKKAPFKKFKSEEQRMGYPKSIQEVFNFRDVTLPENHTTYSQMIEALNVIKSYFSEDLFRVFAIPFDKNGKNVEDKEPNPSTLTYAHKQFNDNPEMLHSNTVSLKPVLFGEGMANISLYKKKHLFSGHHVPVSVRESVTVFELFIEALTQALMKLADEHYAKARALAVGEEGQRVLAPALDILRRRMLILNRSNHLPQQLDDEDEGEDEDEDDCDGEEY